MHNISRLRFAIRWQHLFVFVGLPLLSSAQEGPTNTDPAPIVKPWKFYATVDSAFSGNVSHPANGTNLLRNFDSNSDALSLSGATAGVQYMGEHFGFHLDGGFGEMYRTMGAADPWRGPNRYVGQLYLSYRPLTVNNLQFDVGKFYTSAGAEVPDILADFNYSRSLVFVLGLPYDHFGLRVTIPVTGTLSAGVQVLNGWNNVVDNNTGKTLGFTSALTKTKWAWSQTYLVGPEKKDSSQGYRHLYNAVLTAVPRPWMEGYVEAVLGMEHRAQTAATPDTGRDYWAGGSVAVRFKPAKTLSFSPRWEYFNDETAFTTGLRQHLMEWTGTADYHPRPFLICRLEYRADRSNRPFFDSASRPGSRKDQQTFLMAIIVSVRGER
jgi:hypothetical protein